MVKTLFRAVLLVGLGLGAGFVHAQLNKNGENPLILKLPTPPQPETANSEKSPETTPPATDSPVPGGHPETPRPETEPQQPPAAPPAPVTPATEQPAVPAAPAAEAPKDDGYFISLAKAKEFYDQKSHGQWEGIFIDARPFHDYSAGHIPGSMHVDKKYFDGAVPQKVRDYLPGMAVVIYCHGENCTDSEAVAARLIALKRSIGPIYIIREGYPGWTKAGYPTVAGPEVGFE